MLLAKLTATGTKDATTFLRGDNTFACTGLVVGQFGNLFSNAAKGIYLGVTSATAANLLDDYEEGTWTLAVTGQGAMELCSRYTKIGNRVFIDSYFTCDTDVATAVNTNQGLPFMLELHRQFNCRFINNQL
jgi:hypothetical protein